MPNVSVERLQQYSDEDAAQLGRLMPFLNDRLSGDPVDKELLDAIISSPFHEQLVARLEGRIVGAATLSLIMGAAGKKGHLEDFVTDPEVRGQGIGSRVWDEITAWCQEQDVNLEFTSNAQRQDAHSFYRSHGAAERDTIVFHVDVE